MHTILVDTHVHLTDDELSMLLPHIVAMSRSLNTKAVSVSMDLVTAKKNMELADSCSEVVIPFVGRKTRQTNFNSFKGFS
ncbi:MAG: hypothetical protein ACE5J2_04440 [Nitrososphaerales archaeon]